MTRRSNPSAQSGFTLLETLLVVGLLSGIMLVLTIFLQDYLRREHMRGVAAHLAIVQRAVSESLNTVQEFEALYALATANGNVIELSILNRNNPNRTVSYVPAGNVSLERGNDGTFAPSPIINASVNSGGANVFSGFRDTLPVRASSYVSGIDGPATNSRQEARLTVLARVADDPADDDDERALEVLVITIDRLAEQDLQAIMAETDGNGGLVSAVLDVDPNCDSAGCGVTARSAHGNWYASLSDFAGTRWSVISNARPATLEDGGYLASYTYINEAVLAGDYLFRSAVPNNPNLNTMHTALNLGGNNIVGADNIEVTNPDTPGAGVLTVNRGLFAQGSALVGGAARITGDLIAEGGMAAGAITLGPNYAAPAPVLPSTGNLTVGGEMSTRSMETTGNLSVRGNAGMLALNAKQVSATTLDISDSLTIEASQGLLAGTLKANTVAVKNKTNTGQIEAGQINANKLVAPSVGIVQGQMTGRVTAAQKVNATKFDAGSVTIDNLTRCAKGC